MSGGSSSGRTFQTSNSSSATTPPQAIEGMLKTMANDLGAYYFNHPDAPAYYPGATVAPFSAQTQAALAALFDRGAAGAPVTSAADAAALDTLGGRYLDIGSNPYFQKALAAGFAPQTEQFMASVLPGLRSQFEGAGRTGSGADLDTTLRAVKDLDQAQANAAASASGQAYQQERGNQQQAMALAPALAAQDYSDLDAMLRAGGALDSKAQQNLDADVARYDYQQTAQPQWIADMARLLQAVYPGAASSGSGTASGYSSQAYDNPGSLLNAGLGLAGLAKLSDRRLKTDVRRVGKLDDGQTVYSYRLRGSPRTELGLMAQEVEKRRPDAVRLHPSGFKMIDYRRATRPPRARHALDRAPRGGLM